MISLDDIRSLAALARLKLSGDEETALQKDISNILEYVGQVSAVQGPTLDQDSLRSDLPLLRNVMRDDMPTPTLGERESLIAAFPKEERGYNVVRKIIEKDVQ